MDPILGKIIQAALVLAAFAAAHERFVEILRNLGARFRWPHTDWLSIGAGNVLPALVLSLATQADLLALFHDVAGKGFFDLYLGGPSVWREVAAHGGLMQHLVGCTLMAFSTTLGSQFWHDLAGGLIDLRDKTKAVADETAYAKKAA